MSWKIYHKDGSVLTDVNDEQITVHGLEYSDKWMEECFVTIDFKHEAPIKFAIGDYLIYRNGERFELNYNPGKQKQARVNTYGEGFVYDSVKFNALQDELSRTEFLDVVLSDNQLHYTALPKFSFYVETIDDLLDRIQANLNEQIGDGMWKIFSRSKKRSMQRGITEEEWKAAYGDEETSTGDFDSKSVTIDSKTCWEALALSNTEWDINFVIRNRNVYVGTAGKVTKGIFKYGLGKGLYEIEQNADSDQSIITRLRAYGSEKNLPSHYYADLGLKYKVNITKVKNASTYVELDIDLDYIDTYFTERRKLNGENADGWVLRVTFDYLTEVTGVVTKSSDGKCLFYSEIKGSDNDNADEESKESFDTFVAQVKSGNTKLYISKGLNKKTVPYEIKEYADNLPNNMSISRLMLPGFPHLSLKEFWDSLTDEEKKYVNPSGREHIFSTDKYRPYLDSVNIKKIGLRSASQFFDTDDKTNGVIEIYPTIEEMEIGGVRIDEIYKGSEIDDDGRFDDGETVKNFDIYLNPAIDFDINDLRDDDFSISMKDGMCGGRSFNVASATNIEGMWRLTLERVKDDALDLYFPYNDYPIKKGDHFVLTGIELPESYIKAAALKLLKYAIALLDKNDYTRYVYQPKVDEIFMARQHDEAMDDKTGAIASYHDTLKAGDIMQFEDEDLGIDAQVTIDQLTIKEEDGKIPTYEITLREDKEVGTIEKIQQQISSLQSGNGGSGGGATMSQVKGVVVSEGSKYFLSKLSDDVANGFITFAKGLAIGAKKAYKILSDGAAYLRSLNLDEGLSVDGDSQLGKNGTSTTFGDFHADSSGARIAVNEDGTSTAEFDFITIRRAAEFREITIRELKHIGGELAITAAAMVCSKVEKLDGNGDVVTDESTTVKAYKCYFDTGSNGEKKVYQQFVVGDQARCQQFDIEVSSEDGMKRTRYYWRLVTAIGDDYIVLSDVDKDSGSTTEPQAGDNIVQMGYRYDDRPNRQSAIVFSATADDAPSSKYYQGINSYALNNVVKDEGYDAAKGTFHLNVYGNSYTGDKDGNSFFSYDAKNKKATFKGEVNFTSATKLPSGTTLADGENDYELTTKKDLENFNIRSGNLLRNTAFSGDYESADITDDTEISDDKETFSEKLKYWTTDEKTSVSDSSSSMSGKVVNIGAISQTLDKPLLDGEPYTLSFIGRGTLLVVKIGESVMLKQEMTAEDKRYELHFTNEGASDVVSFTSDNAYISDIMLSYGTIAPAWSPAYVDNDKSVAQFQNYKYLSDAINNASTTIDGGLVMSQMFRVGNYRDGNMVQETGGMSGYYNDANSPFLWGGGTLEQAIYTIQRYKDNPTYIPTEEELKDMAMFVVTHGGWAILNNIILRGRIYAEGGVMKSIQSPNGKFKIDEEGNAKLEGEINATSGKIGGFTISPALFYSGSSDNDDWATTEKQNLIQFGINFLRLAQLSAYAGKTTAYQKIGIGRGSDPNYTGSDADCNSALYIYRQMQNAGHLYYPAVQFISDNVAKRNVALRTEGAVQVHGGLIESGYVLDYGNTTKANVIDISYGTTILIKNNGDSRHFFLPSLSEVQAQGGFSKSDYFCIPMTVIAERNSDNYAYVSTQSKPHTDSPVSDSGEICDKDGNGGYSNYENGNSVRLGKGDCWQFALVNSPSGYYIQVVNYWN